MLYLERHSNTLRITGLWETWNIFAHWAFCTFEQSVGIFKLEGKLEEVGDGCE